ncbi:hypothetical protein RI129_001111 [Pyrocoelia pectoralis]|uniref:Regulatory protein zeste n=1 Tax=Pyrocoelia pectoralis TaxID=417401 RepID=A0AAN7VK49_9COLE
MQKTKRAANFSSSEISTIISLVKKKKFYDIIENKKTDTVTNRNKDEAWRVLAEEFNSISGKIYRDAKSLRGKYENTKKQAKNKYAEEKRYIMELHNEKIRRDREEHDIKMKILWKQLQQ